MIKSSEPTTTVSAVTGDTVTGAHAHVSSKLATVPGAALVTMETITKEERCPAWCVMDHYTNPEQGADGYTCATAWTDIRLPSSTGDNALVSRMDGVERVVRVRRAAFTVEDTDEGLRPGSTDESIELGVDGFDTVGLNEEETRLLIKLLGFHADRLAANRSAGLTAQR